jgi:uncharacterized protein (TIGR03546 family)
MLILKFLQTLIKALNSDGTPGQVAAGMALGAALGLTPLVNLHNLLIAAIAVVTNVSLPGFMLGWALLVPAGFLLDPVFDRVGQWLLLQIPTLRPVWTDGYNSFAVLTNFNNSVVLGSLVCWLVAALPLYFLFRLGITRYRRHIYDRLARTRLFQAVKASKAYNIYRLFQPQ